MKAGFGAVALMALPVAALACGVCIEDKIAATYDHAVVTQAAAQRHVVVFTALEGHSPGDRLASDARQAAMQVRGVDRGTIRVAGDPAAMSFALDPGTQTPEHAIDVMQRNAKTRALKITLLRVVR